MLKVRRRGACCCHSHSQGLFHHHVIVFPVFRAAARDRSSYLRMPQPKGELECIPASLRAPQKCKKVHKNSSAATARQGAAWWAGCFGLPSGMVGLVLLTGISPGYEHPEHPEPLLGSRFQELRTALLLLQRHTTRSAGAGCKYSQQVHLL